MCLQALLFPISTAFWILASSMRNYFLPETCSSSRLHLGLVASGLACGISGLDFSFLFPNIRVLFSFSQAGFNSDLDTTIWHGWGLDRCFLMAEISWGELTTPLMPSSLHVDLTGSLCPVTASDLSFLNAHEMLTFSLLQGDPQPLPF